MTDTADSLKYEDMVADNILKRLKDEVFKLNYEMTLLTCILSHIIHNNDLKFEKEQIENLFKSSGLDYEKMKLIIGERASVLSDEVANV